MNEGLDAIIGEGTGLDIPKLEEVAASADIGLSVGNGKDIQASASKGTAITLQEFLREIYTRLDGYMAENAAREFRIILKFENTSNKLKEAGYPPVSGSYELHEIIYKEIEDPKASPEKGAVDKTGAKKKTITVKEEKSVYSSSTYIQPRAIDGLKPDPDGRGVLTSVVRRQLEVDKRLYLHTYTIRDTTGSLSETYHRQEPKKPSKI